MKLLLSFFILLTGLTSFITPARKANITVSFINTVNGEQIDYNRSYTNALNEQYSITKVKYYISNLYLINTKHTKIVEKNSYHLITESEDEVNPERNKFSFEIEQGTYTTVSFLLGVDSIKNVSGAQTGVLDPMNGMFWTWNTGYIMFKLEGTSPQSNVAGNLLEYHIGGFQGSNNVLRRVELPLSLLKIKKGTHTAITIEANIRKIWNDAQLLSIKETPACTTMGSTAVKIADSYSKIFSVKKIAAL